MVSWHIGSLSKNQDILFDVSLNNNVAAVIFSKILEDRKTDKASDNHNEASSCSNDSNDIHEIFITHIL